jgi:hypothetical protein
VHRYLRDHAKAKGPNKMPAARTPNAGSHAEATSGPPQASRAAPMAHAPNAENPKPTVECIAIVAPRFSGFAAIVMPAVNAPESAGTVPA